MGRPAVDNQPRTAAGHRAVAAVAVVLLVLAGLGPAVAGAQTDTERERDAVRDRQDAVAEQLDVLKASDAQINAALDEIDAAIADQEHVLDDALAEADAAAAAERQARADLRAAEHDVDVLHDAIREMAVASFVHPPTADLVQSLQARSLSDALVQKIYLDARARRDLDLLGLLERAERDARRRADELTVASAAADAAVSRANAELDRLHAEQQRQAAFAADLQDRIDGALAEAAALADLDAELSQQIQQQQAELIARLPPPTTAPPTTVPPTTVPPTTTTTTVDTAAGGATTSSTTTTVLEEDDDSGSTTTERPSTTAPPLRTVQGITVHADIADDVDAMLTAAADDGVSLGGSGYRSTERQIELRRANCGPTDYDIWDRPASSCTPPTAKPGRSMHEQGRAIDMLYEGHLITSRSNPGYVWLAAHAADYGLLNLPSEPWHWSTNGS